MKPPLFPGLLLFALGAVAALAAEGGRTRTYFIAADDTDWNYAPAGDVLASMSAKGGEADVWMKRGANSEPPIFRKAVFHEYTDAGFKTRKPRPSEWEHLGLLGPLIRAEVGDHLQITLKNNTLFPVSLHPHGVFYDKAGEGSRYPDGTSGPDQADDAVLPGQSYTYKWEVPERAGPGPGDGSSVVWLYHSHVDSMRETNAGLVGVIIVTRRGMARPDGSPTDVDREFVTYFGIMDETVSHYSVVNTRLFAAGTAAAMADKDEKIMMPMMPGQSMFAGTADANRFFTINGYIFGNLPMLRMKVGERVRWYVVGLGGETDLHTPHWHGNVVLHEGHRTDVLELLPASMQVADMVPDSPGIWLYHCHVEDHMMAGMTARYEVVK
ncbi:MAG TPA: multicopper oxidase domain-containing protein [Opitutaceae bacterium]|nr:multicopper oxidase domain-containing protein [Opitutaceae bacterium]